MIGLRWKLLRAGIICLTVSLLVSGCHKKSEETPEQLAIEKHEESLKQEHAQKSMVQSILRIPGGPLTMDAVGYLSKLRKNGQLPGTTNGTFFKIWRDPQPTNYPVTRTFVLAIKGGDFESHYTVVKLSTNTVWQLKGAWRTDTLGNTAAVYQVP